MSDKKQIDLTFNELERFTESCNILKSFVHTPFGNLRKLKNNFDLSYDVLKNAKWEAVAIDERNKNLHTQYSGNHTDPAFLKLRSELTDEINKFGKKTFKLNVETMPASDFPNDEEFLEKAQRNESMIRAYLELLGICIIEAKEAKK